jgi:hypothetical protein
MRGGWANMLNRNGMEARLSAIVALGFALLLAICSGANAADRDLSSLPLYDIVAVGRGSGKVLLATLASPAGKLQWRLREIPVSPSTALVRDVQLSVSGTKALVVFADGVSRGFDLTKRITGINSSDPPPPQHRLLQQRFITLSNGNARLVNDLGEPVGEPCSEAKAAVVHEDGRVLCALNDGRLVVVAAGGAGREQLPFHLPQGAQFQLLAGHRDDTRDFLVLLKGPAKRGKGNTQESTTEIVDPRLPETPLGEFANPTVADLRAQLDFRGPDAGQSGAGGASDVSDITLATLAENLDQETHSGEFNWSFFRVVVNPELYAPVLEFAQGEPDYPSDVDIWQEIAPLAGGASRKSYEIAYASMGDRRWSRCTSYVRTRSYPGTWLIEYWFYYPFDEGRPHPHIHDSEHLFVEVDKLGGTVRNVFASDHDSFVPNNLYSTLVKNAPPVTLPLFAMAEFAKHAMAPDLNHDGHFTRGVDDNLHLEPYSFWGLRDRSSRRQVVMEPYLASMSLPRRREDRFALKDADILFPGLDVPPEHLVCTLRPLLDDPPCVNCGSSMAGAGMTHLVDHPDARVPEAIYKPYVVPWREVRFGVGVYDWSEGRGTLSLAYVGDFRHMTGGLLPIPARLGLEFGWKPIGKEVVVPFNGSQQYIFSKSTLFTGVRVERLVTNTQGFYFAATPKWVDISERVVNGVPVASDTHWQYGGVSYHVGYVVELPSAHKGNFTNHIGVVIRDAPQAPILFEWRVSFGIFRQRGRDDFGARVKDRNPYQ